jgi:hypothetical protein
LPKRRRVAKLESKEKKKRLRALKRRKRKPNRTSTIGLSSKRVRRLKE